MGELGVFVLGVAVGVFIVWAVIKLLSKDDDDYYGW